MSVQETFKTRKQALDWLKNQGHKISQGKFYQDCAAGFPSVNQDGSVSKYQTLLYGQQLSGATTPEKPMSVQEDEWRKSKADADVAEMKAEKMRREQDELWLHADEAWGVLAALIGTLRDSCRHHLYTGQVEVVLVADGDQSRSNEVFELADSLIDKAFNEVAGKEMKVQLVKVENT